MIQNSVILFLNFILTVALTGKIINLTTLFDIKISHLSGFRLTVIRIQINVRLLLIQYGAIFPGLILKKQCFFIVHLIVRHTFIYHLIRRNIFHLQCVIGICIISLVCRLSFIAFCLFIALRKTCIFIW